MIMDASKDPTSAAKRARVDAPSAPITQGSVWQQDCNIVLEAERVQFLVHQGVLQTNSSVFEDMLKISRPDERMMAHGFPIVHLHDSSAEVEHMLKALYDRS